jgi:hypothetical protein
LAKKSKIYKTTTATIRINQLEMIEKTKVNEDYRNRWKITLNFCSGKSCDVSFPSEEIRDEFFDKLSELMDA